MGVVYDIDMLGHLALAHFGVGEIAVGRRKRFSVSQAGSASHRYSKTDFHLSLRRVHGRSLDPHIT